MKSSYNQKAQKQKIINEYVELRKEAFREVSVDVMRQTIAILLYSLSRSEQGYSDDDLRRMYKEFVNIINFPIIDGKQIRSDDVTSSIVKQLDIDLDEINPGIGE